MEKEEYMKKSRYSTTSDTYSSDKFKYFCPHDMVLLICVTKVAKSAFDKALTEHEDIDDVVGSGEPTERDHGVDLQLPLLIKIDSSDSHKK
ncbi:hypothetical protein OROMI_026474 [Orobanche minor]